MRYLSSILLILEVFRLTAFADPRFYCIGEQAVVLEYRSVFSVHNPPEPERYPDMRQQPGVFSEQAILSDLQKYVQADEYDFVLLYSLQEVPGWIHSGNRYSQPLGRNIGLNNDASGNSWAPEGWNQLRSVPHMNDVAFIARTSEKNTNYGGALTVFHECFHYWGPNMTRNYSVGPDDWTSGMPVAWLGQSYYHWSWNFIDTPEDDLPGIMASGPTSDHFNAFDLYILGVLGYQQASQSVYTIYEIGDGTKHDLTLDSLIEAMSMLPPYFYEGDGKRIPDIDPSASEFKCLTVIIKGQDDVLSTEDVNLIIEMINDIPGAWNIATWGLSAMSPTVERKASSLADPDGLNVEMAGPGVNVSQFLPAGSVYEFYSSTDLLNWNLVDKIHGEDRVVQRYLPMNSSSLFVQSVKLPD